MYNPVEDFVGSMAACDMAVRDRCGLNDRCTRPMSALELSAVCRRP